MKMKMKMKIHSVVHSSKIDLSFDFVWRNSTIVEIKKKMENDKIQKFKRHRPFCFSLLRCFCCFHFKFYISNQHFHSIATIGKEKNHFLFFLVFIDHKVYFIFTITIQTWALNKKIQSEVSAKSFVKQI